MNDQSSTGFSPTVTQQQLFALSFLASTASSEGWGDIQLQGAFNALKSKMGGWKAVWGPGYFPKTGTPANTVFVAQEVDSGIALPNYVVAIAGTNFKSLIDQIYDLDIVPTDWLLLKGSAGQVTHGDFVGLINMLDIQSNNQSLRDYLAGIKNKQQVTLTFTGHSMGGALAPLLMLSLMDKNGALSPTTTQLNLWKQVNLQATAGPSIGDPAFGAYFKSVFNTNSQIDFIWNRNDVVPHAWNKATMSELTGIYGINFKSTDCVGKAIAFAQGLANATNYAVFQPRPAFNYATQPYAPSDKWTDDSKFIAQLEFQHINAYVNQFGVSALFPLKNPCDNPPTK